MTKISEKELNALVEAVNNKEGRPIGYDKEGSLYIDRAYGKFRVVEAAGGGGIKGARFNFASKRDCFNYLSGRLDGRPYEKHVSRYAPLEIVD